MGHEVVENRVRLGRQREARGVAPHALIHAVQAKRPKSPHRYATRMLVAPSDFLQEPLDWVSSDPDTAQMNLTEIRRAFHASSSARVLRLLRYARRVRAPLRS